jgi:hypothetical protein
MTYARWSSLWHAVFAAEPNWTLCGRPVPEKAARRDLPPWEPFLCLICGKRA